MTTYNTGNPLGSADPRDLYDNAENLDEAVNSDGDTYQDRLGKSRLTWAGMESGFGAAQDDREQRFNTFIASSGYQFVGDYAPGIEITEYNQLIRDESGEFWRVSGQVDLPYVTTGSGIPEDDALVPAGDAVLRQDLTNPDKGAAMVARGVVAVDSIAYLLALPEGQRKEELRYLVRGYHNGSDVGGGVFYWDALAHKDSHDGMKTFSPTVPFGDILGFVTGTGETTPAGTGCFIREGTPNSLEDAGGSQSFEPTTNKSILDLTIARANGRDMILTIPPEVGYGLVRASKSTHPDFSTVTDPESRIIILDYTPQDPAIGNPVSRAGTQSRTWYHTGNGQDGQHNGNFHYICSDWHAGIMVNHTGDRGAMAAGPMGINRRASIMFSTDDVVNWRVGQGSRTGDFNEDELANFIISANGLPDLGVSGLTTVFAINKTNGNIGINTADPGSMFHARTREGQASLAQFHAATGSDFDLRLYNGNGHAAGVISHTHGVRITFGGARKLDIHENGSVEARNGVGGGAFTTAQRQTLTGLPAGVMVFDTTLNKPLWFRSGVWVDATGVNV